MLLCILLLIVIANADESGCPAHKATIYGFTAFKTFHHLISPLWHQAWPAKDYDALVAAGDDFKQVFAEVAKTEPKSRNKFRIREYETLRAKLGVLVENYAQAAAAGEKDKVYAILPELHNAFEITAAALLPIPYMEVHGLYVTSKLIVEKHLVENNVEGIQGSTEVVVTKVKYLTERSIPIELADQKDGLLAEFATLKDRAAKMKACCDESSMTEYRTHAVAMNQQLAALIEYYL